MLISVQIQLIKNFAHKLTSFDFDEKGNIFQS